jgi:hypothetical protein
VVFVVQDPEEEGDCVSDDIRENDEILSFL